MCAQQNTKMNMMCYYDARVGVSVYGGLFNPLTCKPFCTYYGFKAFGELYALKNQVECLEDQKGIYAIAATDGSTDAVLISNLGDDTQISTNLDGFDVYLVDEEHMLENIEMNSLNIEIKKYQVMLIKKAR